MQEIIQTRFPHQIAVQVNSDILSANGGGTELTKEEIGSLREQIRTYLKEQKASVRYEEKKLTGWLWQKTKETGRA